MRVKTAVLFFFSALWILQSPAKCINQLSDSIHTHNVGARSTPRDVRVVEINDAWNDLYNSQRFHNLIERVLRHTPPTFIEKVKVLLDELDKQAQLGRIKNLNEWIGNISHSFDAPAMSFMVEAEYALYVIKQNPRYVVTFEPDGGFYRGDARAVARLGMRQKSIDLRISDIETGEVLALREVKSSAGRSHIGDNMRNAFEKVRLVHHLEVPELQGLRPVEIGLVYFYDFDPNYESNPYSNHSFYWTRDKILQFLDRIQEDYALPEKPFDTITFMDFGSRRTLYVKRLADDSLEVSDFAMPQDAFISVAPKLSPADGLALRSHLLGTRTTRN